MTKSDLIDHLCEAEKMPKGRAELLINAIFDCMEASLRRGERIEIRNYKAYEGRNPRTGDPVGVQPKRLPFFKVGKELKERVNAAAMRAAAAANGNAATNANNANKKTGTEGGSAAASPAEVPATAPASTTSVSAQSTPAPSRTSTPVPVSVRA